MESVATRLNSPRFQRYLLWFGVAVFAVGAAVLVFTVVGGSDNTPANPDKGFHPTLPAKAVPLKNADGAAIKTFSQLDPQIRSDITTFIGTAVARKNLGDSWAVVSPTLRAGYTPKQWRSGADLPVVPYPGVDTKHIEYYLDYASTKEILIEVGLAGKPGVSTRPVTFQLGLVPAKGSAHHWLVDYWMPRWTPPVPSGS
ncbi:MAG: hypothetical protein ACJ75Q_00470 [Gaiellaceae bacterium]